MKRLLIVIPLMPMLCQGQVSYWFQGWQRQGNARYAQEYFMLAGTNITFTYPANNHVVINATGTNVVLPNVYATNVINPPWQIGCPNLTNWCFFPTNVLGNFDPLGSAQSATNGWPWGALYQPSCANLTNWCQVQTNVLTNYQPFCANLLAWCTNDPSTYTNGLGGGGSPQTNISYTAVTNAPWQWGCDNLTNWCQFPTNILGTIATNSTNFTLTVSNNIWVNIGTSNFITAATSGVQTNWTNIWTGTNTFNQDVYAVRSLTVGTNVNTASTNSIRFRNGNGANWIMAEDSFTTLGFGANGLAWRTLADNMSTPAQLEFHGRPLVFNCTSTDPMYFYNNGALAATIAGQSLRVGPAPVFFGGSEQAYITATNLFYTPRYARLNSGLVIATNAWNLSGLGSFAVGDTFQNGDMFIANSNSIPYAICKSTNGVVTTNLMLHVAESATNDWHTFGNTLGGSGPFLGTLDAQNLQIKVANIQEGLLDTNGSVALGKSCIASGIASVAIGTNSTATATYSIGMGQDAAASAINSISIGSISVASQVGASAIGYNSQATALGATGLGYGSLAAGTGSVAVGFSSAAQGDYSLAIGRNAGQNAFGNYSVCIGRDSSLSGITFAESAFMLGYNTIATGDFSYAIGDSATANNNGSMVLSDSTAAGYSDTAANQFVGYFSGGYHLNSVGAGLHTDGPTFSTNGYYYNASTNGVAPPPAVIQPLHTWASMMMTNTNTFNFGANTYGIVTNYSVVRTNLMFANKAHGCVTNTIAGYYYCAIHMSARTVGSGDFLEGDVLLNGVPRDEISFQTQFDPGGARYKGVSAFGILYITNNTQITFQIKCSGASGVEVSRAQLVVMPP